MSGKVTIDEALEWMRDQNRKNPNPCPEDSFEETLQDLARPMMEAGLIEDVEVVRVAPTEWDSSILEAELHPNKFYNYVLGKWFDPKEE